MGADAHEDLLERARRTGFRPDGALVDEIEAALVAAIDDGELGRLYLAKAIALQGRGDSTPSAAASRRAIDHLVAAGDRPLATLATAMTAVWVGQSGDLAAAIELAVDALVLHAELDVHDMDSARALYAASGFFMRLAAFDVAIDSAQHAFETVQRIGGAPADGIAYTVGYMAVEGVYVSNDPQRRAYRGAVAIASADWLREHGVGDISTEMVSFGLRADTDLAHGGEGIDLDRLDAATRFYDGASPDLVAWHRLVRGTAVARTGNLNDAVALLDAALPGLEASADHHCVVRAMRLRAECRAELGDIAGAYEDALRLADLVRGWQLDQVGHLANQVARRADLELTSRDLKAHADWLAADVDIDALTGVNARRWLDRRLAEVASEGGSGSIAMLDIDKFKMVNDRHGHVVGDEVLRRFGGLLRTFADSSDHAEVARFGGEEFAVILQHPDPTVAVHWCEEFRLEVAAYDWEICAPGLAVTVSAGIGSGSLRHVNALLAEADSALFAAKRHGRNLVVANNPLEGREAGWRSAAVGSVL